MMLHMSILSFQMSCPIQLSCVFRRGGGQLQEQHPGRGLGTSRVRGPPLCGVAQEVPLAAVSVSRVFWHGSLLHTECKALHLAAIAVSRGFGHAVSPHSQYMALTVFYVWKVLSGQGLFCAPNRDLRLKSVFTDVSGRILCF